MTYMTHTSGQAAPCESTHLAQYETVWYSILYDLDDAYIRITVTRRMALFCFSARNGPPPGSYCLPEDDIEAN